MPVKSVKMFKVGEHGEVPGPEVFWMKEFGKWYPLTFYSFLVRLQSGYLLVNTGLVEDLSKRNQFLRNWAGTDRCKFTSYGRIDHILEEAGVSPDEVTHVVVTPVQDYTVGGLPLFKRASLYFSRKGWYNDVVTPGPQPFLNRDIYLPKYVRSYLFEEAWERISLVDDQEIVEGVSLLWTGCHHRSSMAVQIDLSEGKLCLTDTAFTLRNLSENVPIGIAEDIYECLDAYRRLRESCVKVVPAYDPDNPKNFPELL
ncbi:hypothetical protein HS1genome_1312 [Sulfodiicoccus acidiphilus]|uniref:Zn-dependent hydrolase n=1 Tax=Sulfodiicoccus acidiphilus TaxID=1670455 RepID=A0A348B421_9CREN|nr:Zn-dependent hydrolase [Sulfodiicoccus acidiphilus]BBD72923.1 hypothetical protein HS1genome_1312 [Sulfodiicoccus acidiphilus]GGT87973.1 hypothetical protein GCM10007116_02400 [Sulfodiicoccus acidiphilus]